MTPGPISTYDRATFVADVTVPDGTVFSPNASFTKTWRLRNTGSSTWNKSYGLVFVSGDQLGGPAQTALAAVVAPNTSIDISVNLASPVNPGAYRGYWMLKNASGQMFGIGTNGNKPFWVDIVVAGFTPTPTSIGPTATATPISSGPTLTPPPTPFNGNWLTYTNAKYQFHFQYPPDAQPSDLQDNSVRMDLPFVPGTNLGEKYLQMVAVEGSTSCSGLTTEHPPATSQQVTINGIVFTRQTGTDQGMSQLYQWTNYFTVKGNVCVSMGFLLHSAVPGVLPTDTPQFNFDAESLLFGQMMSTFMWDNP